MSAMRSITISLILLVSMSHAWAENDMLMKSTVYVEDGTLASKTTLHGTESTAYGTGEQREALSAKADTNASKFGWEYQVDGQDDDPMNYARFKSKGAGMGYSIDSWGANQLRLVAESDVSGGIHEVNTKMMAKNSWFAGERVFTNIDADRHVDLTGNFSIDSNYKIGNLTLVGPEGDWLDLCNETEKRIETNGLVFTPPRNLSLSPVGR